MAKITKKEANDNLLAYHRHQQKLGEDLKNQRFVPEEDVPDGTQKEDVGASFNETRTKSLALFQQKAKNPYKVNLYYARESTLMPKILIQSGRVKVTPKIHQLDEGVKGFADCLAAVYAEIDKAQNFTSEFRKGVLSAELGGVSIMKIGWDVFKNMPKIELWDTDRVTVDPKVRVSFESARWVSFETEMRFDMVKEIWKDRSSGNAEKGIEKDPSYNADFTKEMTPNTSKAQGSAQGEASFSEEFADRMKFVRIVETHSIDDGIVVWSPQSEEIGRHLKNWAVPLEPEQFPAVELRFNESEEDFWTPPDFKMAKPLYDYLDNAADFMMTQAAQNAIQKIIINSNLSPEAKKALLSNKNLEAVMVDGDDVNKVATVLDMGGLNRAILEMYGLLKGVLDEVSGFSELQRGASSGGSTATEATIQDEWASGRLDKKRRTVDVEYLPEVAIKVLQYVVHLMTPEQVTELVGPDLGQHFKRIDPKDIRKLFNVTVEPGSTRQREREREKGEAIDFYGIAKEFLPMNFGGLQLLKTYNDVAKAYKPHDHELYSVSEKQWEEGAKSQREADEKIEQAFQEGQEDAVNQLRSMGWSPPKEGESNAS